MALEAKIVDRIQSTLCLNTTGTVEQRTIERILLEFKLTASQVGRFVKTVFPTVRVTHGKGKKSTVYEGISIRASSPHHGQQPTPNPVYSPVSLLHQPVYYMPHQVSMLHQPSSSSYQPAQYTAQDVNSIIHKYEKELAHIRTLNTSLSQQLEAARSLHPTNITAQLRSEVETICSSHSPLSTRVRTIEDIRSISPQQTTDYLEQNAPTLYNIIANLTSPQYDRETERSASVSTMLLSTIANHRSRRSNGLQTIIGLMLVARTSSDQVIQLLNHTGLSAHPKSVWGVIKEYAEKRREEKLPPDMVWVYDNVNIMKRVRQVRKESHAVMFNWTSRLALPLKKNPEGLSSAPQGRRQDLSPADILPGVTEVESLKERLSSVVRTHLREKFKEFSAVPATNTTRRWVPAVQYTPVELLDLDESKTSDNIRIICTFAEEAGMTRQHNWDQLVIGDQATCKNIRGAKRLRMDDSGQFNKLAWAKENPGDFHFLWEVGKCILLAHWTSPVNVGSIAHLKDLVNRRTLDLKGSNFNVLDDFLQNITDAHLTAALLSHLGMASADAEYQGEDSIDDICLSFVDTFLTKRRHQDRRDDALLDMTSSLLYHLLLYRDLRQSIRFENGPAIVSHWQLWLPTFLGTKRTQYSTEAANLIANIKADWSEEVAALATHNRTANQHGREGHGKPIDMLMEHYNRILKTVLRSSGGHLTSKHAKEVSLAIPLLDEASKFCDRMFSVKKTVKHTSPSAEKDIQIMTQAIVSGNVYRVTPGRKLFPGKAFQDPVVEGMRRITEDKWLVNFLQKEGTTEEEEQEPALEDHELADLDALMDE